MKKNNKYGFVSGGYLFDIMDRYALEKLIDTKGTGFYFTASANISYQKQCCDHNDLCLQYTHIAEDPVHPDNYSVNVIAYSPKTKIQYASALFLFTRKNHNYCEKK